MVDTIRIADRKAMTRLFVVPTPVVPDVSINFHGSLKKRVAPAPPPGTILDTSSSGQGLLGSHYGTLPSASHARTTSEPIFTSYPSDYYSSTGSDYFRKSTLIFFFPFFFSFLFSCFNFLLYLF